MPITRWIVALSDAALFAAALLTLMAAPLLCVLLVLSDHSARRDGDTALPEQPSRAAVTQARCAHTSDASEAAVPALAACRRREAAP